MREKVSIRNLEAILEVLADAGRSQRDPGALAEQVRQRLGQAICRSLSGETSTLHVITLDPLTETHIGNSTVIRPKTAAAWRSSRAWRTN